MKIRNPGLLLILCIIGAGMINSLFQPEPEQTQLTPEQQKEVDRVAHNAEVCKSKGLVYVSSMGISGSCATENERKNFIKNLEKGIEQLNKHEANLKLK